VLIFLVCSSSFAYFSQLLEYRCLVDFWFMILAMLFYSTQV
jgi:hypothetical protein